MFGSLCTPHRSCAPPWYPKIATLLHRPPLHLKITRLVCKATETHSEKARGYMLVCKSTAAALPTMPLSLCMPHRTRGLPG